MRTILSKSVLIVCFLFGTYAQALVIDFYGHTLDIETSGLNRIQTPGYISKNNLSSLLYRLESKDHNNMLSQVYDAQVSYGLDDMGMVLLTKKITKEVSPSRNTRNLLQFFILDQLGYDVKLTYTKTSVSCFGLLDDRPAASIYIYQDGKRYTNLDFHDTRVMGTRYLYRSASSNGRTIQFTGALPKVDAKLSNRSFKWFFQGKLYQLEATNNQSFTEYLNDLPQFQLGKDYTGVSHSSEFASTVLNPLKNYMEDMTSLEQKANFLLNFVQSSFSYKTDQDQYGREKYNYPEETLSSSYSDCEDRTILLAYLYQELLGLESVILHFKKEKHVCLGLKLPHRSNSYSFKYRDAAFMVCEPTGRGYKVGDTAIGLHRISEVIELY
ncbi:MAG: hypothetical protein JJ975_12270 [Bacteroidia bacterium]|nr:hypothetical protein [Bacteroidia bacterium]